MVSEKMNEEKHLVKRGRWWHTLVDTKEMKEEYVVSKEEQGKNWNFLSSSI